MPECEEVKSPTSSQETVLFNGLLDLSFSCGSLSRIYEERQNAGWKTSIWYCGVVRVVHRQVPELISGPDLATRALLMSFNVAQFRVVIGLLTGHNTLRRHLYTGCNRRNGPDFGRVFLMLNYTEKPQNTYIQS